MLTHDPFNIARDVNNFKTEVQQHLTSTDEINKSVSIFRQISLCNTMLSHTPNLNHSSYIKGFIYDTLNSLIAIIKKRERYLQLNFRSMVEHVARISLNKNYNGGDFDQTVRRKDFDFLKAHQNDEGWVYLHNVYINACYYVHSSPQANLNVTSTFISLMEGDCNSTQHKMVTKLHEVVSALMKIIIKYYHQHISNIFFRNMKDLKKIMGNSLYLYYTSLDN
ncbi:MULTISPECIES: hypothetical protein [Enterobacter cloacae complex]|uniref:hypothetical protein n=1 Tax=Enterobacter cloacae complex TaxID=354276 RepID=UPI000E335A94|nr:MULTISPECIES: hypothetical protein [Enterobacter cloacae complex]AXQ32941.1 hypothetical protein D0Z05_05810 [Enterobacter hormaechei]EMC9798371.1 hypothetical protein [Enterobacter hormaechei]MBW7746018.1 hypothetical protein [Enterobacter hormaechei]MBW9176269.1 hypothetical protein [Enterobacter hormaechei]MCE1300631.1 hypothetical protein [Enterobacter hormaechei]